MITKVLVNKEGKYFFVSDSMKELHTDSGMFSAAELKKKKGIVKSNKGIEFFIFPATFADKMRRLKRGAQIITAKDAGVIIAETGINSKSRIVEAGGGSGGLTCTMANIAEKVTTYEIREPFVEIIKHNVEQMGFENVTIKNKDVTQGISEKNVDLVVLDMLEPEKALSHAAKSLKYGGFLVVYQPSITQIISVINEAGKCGFIMTKTMETLQRRWEIHDKVARPEFRMLGHTGFMAFFRRVC